MEWNQVLTFYLLSLITNLNIMVIKFSKFHECYVAEQDTKDGSFFSGRANTVADAMLMCMRSMKEYGFI